MIEAQIAQVKHEILDRIGRMILDRAVDLSPKDQGNLMRNLDYEVKGNSVIIGTGVGTAASVDYADKMEYGSPPNLLSENEKQDVEEWAGRHGLKSGKGVIWSLEHKGIKVGTPENPLHITSYGRDSWRPFLRPALHQCMADINKLINKSIK